MTPLQVPLVLTAIGLSFSLSAAAGMGGSLVLVPVLVALLGVKEGVALAALLLAANNVVKVGAYRATLPYRRALGVAACIGLGAFAGAGLLVAASEELVTIAVIASILITFALERIDLRLHAAPPLLGFGAGAASGFSGTSGPLKGIALRTLALDRMHLVGAASLASLVGDATKTAVFAHAGLLPTHAVAVAASSIPLMFAGSLLGRRFNAALGERGYATLFWLVMTGYGARLILT